MIETYVVTTVTNGIVEEMDSFFTEEQAKQRLEHLCRMDMVTRYGSAKKARQELENNPEWESYADMHKTWEMEEHSIYQMFEQKIRPLEYTKHEWTRCVIAKGEVMNVDQLHAFMATLTDPLEIAEVQGLLGLIGCNSGLQSTIDALMRLATTAIYEAKALAWKGDHADNMISVLRYLSRFDSMFKNNVVIQERIHTADKLLHGFDAIIEAVKWTRRTFKEREK